MILQNIFGLICSFCFPSIFIQYPCYVPIVSVAACVVESLVRRCGNRSIQNKEWEENGLQNITL